MLRLTAVLVALLLPLVAAAGTADLRVSVEAPARIERGVTQVTWKAIVENLGPDAARNVAISIGTFPYRDCRSETVESFPAGERRTYDCLGDVPPAVYTLQMSASAFSGETDDPDRQNNMAWQNAEVMTDPDVVALVLVPDRVDPALPFPFDVSYRNVARTTATGVMLTVEISGADRITRAPEGCVVTEQRAVCALGDLPPETDPFNAPGPFLRFETVAPDRKDAYVRIAALARGNEPDPAPGNNESIDSAYLYRTWTVSNASDGGSGSLRAAIDEVNASCAPARPDDPCKIAFRIPNGGASWTTIRPVTPLPAITAADVIVDGTTQTRFFGDTNPSGPEVELSGALLEGSGNGLTLAARCGGSVYGLAVNGFPDNGIRVGGEACTDVLDLHVRHIRGNYIGTDPTGARRVPNLRGIFVAAGDDFRTPAWITENVISGNRYSGIWVASGSQTRIFKNVIGLTPDVKHGLGNGSSGVYIERGGSGTGLSDNYIGFNGHYGLSMASGTYEVEAITNSFQANGNLAIDHGLDGVSPSVPDGGEHPGSDDLPAPAILSARYDASRGVTVVEGSVGRGGPVRGSIFVTLFANDAPDESGFGEGQYLLGYANADREGRFAFTYQGRTPGRWIAATATSYHIWGFARLPGSQARGGGYSTTTTEFSRTVEVQ